MSGQFKLDVKLIFDFHLSKTLCCDWPKGEGTPLKLTQPAQNSIPIYSICARLRSLPPVFTLRCNSIAGYHHFLVSIVFFLSHFSLSWYFSICVASIRSELFRIGRSSTFPLDPIQSNTVLLQLFFFLNDFSFWSSVQVSSITEVQGFYFRSIQ